MKYCITAMVEMTGSYDAEIEADSLEEAEAMAKGIINNLRANDVCWSGDVYPYCDCEVSLAEEENEDEDDDEYVA